MDLDDCIFTLRGFLRRFLASEGSKTKPVRSRIVTFVTLVETRKFIFSRPVSAVFSISHLFQFYEMKKIWKRRWQEAVWEKSLSSPIFDRSKNLVDRTIVLKIDLEFQSRKANVKSKPRNLRKFLLESLISKHI